MEVGPSADGNCRAVNCLFDYIVIEGRELEAMFEVFLRKKLVLIGADWLGRMEWWRVGATRPLIKSIESIKERQRGVYLDDHFGPV